MSTDKLSYWRLPEGVEWWDYNDEPEAKALAKDEVRAPIKALATALPKALAKDQVKTQTKASLYQTKVSWSVIVSRSQKPVQERNQKPIKVITTQQTKPVVKTHESIKPVEPVVEPSSTTTTVVSPPEPVVKRTLIETKETIEPVAETKETILPVEETALQPMDIDSVEEDEKVSVTKTDEKQKTKAKKKKNKNKKKKKVQELKHEKNEKEEKEQKHGNENLLAQFAIAERCLLLAERELDLLDKTKDQIFEENTRIRVQYETLEAKHKLIEDAELQLKKLQAKLRSDKVQLRKDQEQLTGEQKLYQEKKEKFIQDCDKMQTEVPIVERRQQYLELKEKLFGLNDLEKGVNNGFNNGTNKALYHQHQFTAYRFTFTFHNLNYNAMQQIIELSREGLALLQSILILVGETDLVVEIKMLNRMVRYLMKNKQKRFFYVMWPNKGRETKPGLETGLAYLLQKSNEALKYAEKKLHTGLSEELAGKKRFQRDMKTFLLQNACQSALDVQKIALAMLKPNQTNGFGAYLKSIQDPHLCPECKFQCYESQTVCKACEIDVCSDLCAKVYRSRHDSKQCVINASIDHTIQKSLKGGENCMGCGISLLQWLWCRFIVFSLINTEIGRAHV